MGVYVPCRNIMRPFAHCGWHRVVFGITCDKKEVAGALRNEGFKESYFAFVCFSALVTEFTMYSDSDYP